jgi:hypothetical protein
MEVNGSDELFLVAMGLGRQEKEGGDALWLK